MLCSRAMARLWNLEALALMLGGLALVVYLSVDGGLGWLSGLTGFAWLVASVPLAMSLQGALVPLYLQAGLNRRALHLALLVRETAPSRKIRDLASVDVAMVHLTEGRFDDALRNLDGINASALGTRSRALVEGNRAYCRAHLDRELDRALAQAEEARTLDPDEGLLAYFEGLVRFKRGDLEGALREIEASLEAEPDPTLPFPGERPFVLSQILAALGRTDEAAARLDEAARRARRGPFAEAVRAARAGENGPAGA